MTSSRPRWSQTTDARLGGLSLAREARRLLAWDEARNLYLWRLEGGPPARHTHLQPIVRAAISDDGGAILLADAHAQLSWLTGEMHLRFSLPIDFRPLQLAVEPLGRRVAVSDPERLTLVFDSSGKQIATLETPRPLRHLAFVPSETCLIGAADYGYVGCFDAAGRCLWRDAPVSHVGSLCVDGAGVITLACFSNGLQRYERTGKHLGTLSTPWPCRLAAADWDGGRILVAGDAGSLSLLKADGAVIGEHPTNRPISALALGALGEVGAYGHAHGEVVVIDWA